MTFYNDFMYVGRFGIDRVPYYSTIESLKESMLQSVTLYEAIQARSRFRSMCLLKFFLKFFSAQPM